jgi:hypothetical protein
LILKANLDNTSTSNYVLSTSNNLILKAILDNTNTSNYVLSTSNNLILKAILDNTNTSNYVLSSINANIIDTNLTTKISLLCNTLLAIDNINDINVSNYVLSSSNNLSDRITNLNMANASSGTLAVARGGTGSSTLTAGQVLIGNNATALFQTANLTWDVANNRLGIGTATPAVSLHVVGEIVATNNITPYYSDERLKTKLSDIHEPLKIINKLNGFYYIPNELARMYGITNTEKEIGLSAQDVQKVLPELVKIAPFDLATDEDGNKTSKSGENYLTMSYERLAPVFVEAIKVLEQKNFELTDKYNKLLEDITIIKKKLLIES